MLRQRQPLTPGMSSAVAASSGLRLEAGRPEDRGTPRQLVGHDPQAIDGAVISIGGLETVHQLEETLEEQVTPLPQVRQDLGRAPSSPHPRRPHSSTAPAFRQCNGSGSPPNPATGQTSSPRAADAPDLA